MTRNRKPSAAPTATLALVSRDVGFVIGMIRRLVEIVAEDVSATWLFLIYQDWFSLVVYEARELARKGVTITGSDAPILYAEELNAARQSTKLLNDTKKTVEQLLEDFRKYSAKHRDQLINMTKAPFLIRKVPFFAALQEDTAVVLLDGEILATSHSIRHHSGLEMDADRDAGRNRGEEVGAALRSMSDQSSEAWEELTVNADWQFPPLTAMDTKSAEFFGSTFRDFPIGESMALSLVSCRLRAALAMGRAVRAGGETLASLAFKFRFAAIWQSTLTLRVVADSGTSFKIGNEQLEELRRVLGEDSVATLTGQAFRGLRNVLVHYRVTRKQNELIGQNDPLIGLTQALCGKTWQELDDLIDDAASALLKTLDHWRGSFGGLLREPS